MKLLPAFIGIKVRSTLWRMPTLWLPLFLLWPLFFILLVLLFALGFIFTLILEARSISRFFVSYGAFYDLLCETRGTKINLEGKDTYVFIAIH